MATFSISEEQKSEYFNRGYTSIKNALSPDLLERLQNMAMVFENDIMEKYQKGEKVNASCVVHDLVGDRLARFDDVYSRDIDTTLDLLSSPVIMAIFRDICGRTSVPLGMDIIYKHQHPHPTVNWHQDTIHSRNYPYLNVGIFLDDSNKSDGCLRYIPGSQYEKQDIEILSKEHGWNIPNNVEFSAKAGDVNIHDIMILHGSEPKKSEGVRRTIYIEIRPYDAIIEDSKQSKEWVDLRKRFMGLVLRRANLEDWPDEWKDDYPRDLGTDEEEIKKIVEMREAPSPAYYATFPVDHPEYPVPSDMR